MFHCSVIVDCVCLASLCWVIVLNLKHHENKKRTNDEKIYINERRERERESEGGEQEREREKLAYPEFFVPFSDQSLWVFVSFSLLIFDKLSRN